jgi:hypothetical protein
MVSALSLAAASTVPGWGATTLTTLTKIAAVSIIEATSKLTPSEIVNELSADFQRDF